MILFLISTFFPFKTHKNFGWSEQGGYDLLFGGWEGLIIIFIATLFILNYKIRFAVVCQIIGCISIFSNVLTLILNPPQLFIAGVGSFIILFPSIGFVVNIVFIIKKKSLDKEVADEKFQRMLGRSPEDVNLKTRLFGMIKVEKQFNLETAQDMLKIPKKEIKELIYDLVGEGKLEGEFQDETFLISSDIDDFLSALDSSFQEWEEKVQSKEKKI